MHTRFLLNWSFSNTMDPTRVTTMVCKAIAKYGGPDIIKSDHGCQFNGEVYTGMFRMGGVAEVVRAAWT